MGCSASTLDNEESVARCKDRKRYIKLAVQYRHAFAAAHASYIQSLKNTGAAIRQFGEGEAKEHQVAQIPPSVRNTLPLPPPVPHFLNLQAPSPPRHSASLPRATSMPPMALRRSTTSPIRSPSMTPPAPFKEEDAEKEFRVGDPKPPPRLPVEPQIPPPPPPPPSTSWDMFDMFPPSESTFDSADQPVASEGEYTPAKVKRAAEENGELAVKRNSRKLEEEEVLVEDDDEGDKVTMRELQEPPAEEKDGYRSFDTSYRTRKTGKNLYLVLKELDDHFLTAFESGKEAARMLEAQRTHYHSNFADSNGNLDHYTKLKRVMSWDSYQQVSFSNESVNDPIYGNEKVTHASTLDKLLAWEKKFHDDVKAGEVIRIELERRSVQLKNQKKREEDSTTINKTKAIVKSLQTRYLVEFQAVDADSLEIQKLRDDYLHKQLVGLVKESMSMWRTMFKCHQQQYQMIEDMESLDRSYAPTETTEFHRRNTLQLEVEVNLWHQNFDKLVTNQKEYMNALYHWLRLNITEIEDGKDKPASPKKMNPPPVYHLCQSWLDALDHFPGNVPLHALKAFSNIIHELTEQQAEELKQKKKVESLQKELYKKEQALKAQEMKYIDRHTYQQVSDEKEELVQEHVIERTPFKEKEAMIEALKKKLEAENEIYEKLRLKSGSMTLNILQKGLPPVLNAIKEFARTCSEHYTGLYRQTVEEEDIPKLQISY